MTYRKYDRKQVRHQCPTCKRVALTDAEKARGYQCLDCTRRDESDY